MGAGAQQCRQFPARGTRGGTPAPCMGSRVSMGSPHRPLLSSKAIGSIFQWLCPRQSWAKYNKATTTEKQQQQQKNVANSAKIKNKMQTGILFCFCQVGSFPISVSEHRKPLCEQLPSIPYLSSRAAALRLALVAEIAVTGIEGRSEGRNSTETGTLQ